MAQDINVIWIGREARCVEARSVGHVVVAGGEPCRQIVPETLRLRRLWRGRRLVGAETAAHTAAGRKRERCNTGEKECSFHGLPLTCSDNSDRRRLPVAPK